MAAALTDLSALQHLVGQVVQGLSAMQDAQATQTEMLRALLAAATAPTDPENAVADALRHISHQIAAQSQQAQEIRSVLTGLPSQVHDLQRDAGRRSVSTPYFMPIPPF